jgi:hypothetical protein
MFIARPSAGCWRTSYNDAAQAGRARGLRIETAAADRPCLQPPGSAVVPGRELSLGNRMKQNHVDRIMLVVAQNPRAR